MPPLLSLFLLGAGAYEMSFSGMILLQRSLSSLCSREKCVPIGWMAVVKCCCVLLLEWMYIYIYRMKFL